MDQNTTNSQIIISGKVHCRFAFSHEVYGEGFYRFDAEVFRLSNATDIMPVTVSERIVDAAGLPMGTGISVCGQIRSYNSYVEEDRRNKLVLTVFARDIEATGEENLPETNPNEVYLNGFVCKPPVYRTTPFGREIADILLAVNRSYNKSDYIPCIAWGRNARYAEKLTVGDNIQIWGRMQSRTYQKKYETGEIIEKVAYEVSVSKLSPAPVKEDGE